MKKVISFKKGVDTANGSEFAALCSRFKSSIQIEQGVKTINGKSLMGVLSLSVGQKAGSVLIVKGEDEQRAMRELSAFIEQKM